MTKPIFIILRILIVALTFFIPQMAVLGAGPVITVGASHPLPGGRLGLSRRTL